MFAAQKEQHGYLLAWICNATAYVLQCLNTKHPKYYLRVREAQHKICHTRMQKENMVATLEALLASSGASPLCHCFFSLKDKTMETVFCFWNQFLKSFITKSLLGLCCYSAAAVVTAHLQNKTLKHLHEFVTSVAAPSIISHCKNTHLHLCCWSIDHLAMDHLSLQEDPSPLQDTKKNINSSSLCLLLPQSRNEQQFAFFLLHATPRWFQAWETTDAKKPNVVWSTSFFLSPSTAHSFIHSPLLIPAGPTTPPILSPPLLPSAIHLPIAD